MKKANIINKVKGILIILVGVLLAAAGVWLYSKIWGINLLFTDATLGKIARFYWIFLIVAVIMVALGIRKFRKRIPVEPEQASEEQASQAEPQEKTQVDTPEENVKEIQSTETQSGEKVMQNEAKEEAEPAEKEEKVAKKPFMKKKSNSTCPNCNKPIGKGNKFCTSCGHKLV